MATVFRAQNQNQEATVWCGNLDPQCTEELIFDLFINAGPVVNVNMPRDKVTNTHQGYAFVEFETPEDAEYAIKVMNMIKLYGKLIRVNLAAKDRKQEEFFANLFVGNLDPEVDEKMLYETFSRFGCVISAKIMTEPDSIKSRGFGFVTFDSFEASDLGIQTMNGQYLCNRPIHVSYAFKKDGTKGERHGTPEERILASQASSRNLRPKPDMMALASSLNRTNQPSRGAAPSSFIPTTQYMPAMSMPMSMPGMPMGMPGMPGMPMPPMPPMPGYGAPGYGQMPGMPTMGMPAWGSWPQPPPPPTQQFVQQSGAPGSISAPPPPSSTSGPAPMQTDSGTSTQSIGNGTS